MLSLKLEKLGYAVVSAANGREGVERALKENPDLIVMDIMMPVMDGFSAVEELRRRDSVQDRPVVFLSAKGQEEDRLKAKALGAVDFIGKPFSPALLVQRISEILR